MEQITWQIGIVKITQIVEMTAGPIIQEVIPNASQEAIRGIPWLRPHFADEEGNLRALVQAFVLDTPEARIVVDTCVGNGKPRTDMPQWGGLQTDFLKRLRGAGYPPESINSVLCTHLHFDHVGWNTMLSGGKWVPTFPRARYLFAEPEFQYWREYPAAEIADDHAGIRDSVMPVFEAGLVDLIPIDHHISNEVSLIPTPGHTPAHVSIFISSGGDQALITGDVAHHPCQFAHPEWSTLSDTDKELGCKSRRAILDRFADTPTLVIGSHFAAPTAGRVVRDGTAFRLLA